MLNSSWKHFYELPIILNKGRKLNARYSFIIHCTEQELKLEAIWSQVSDVWLSLLGQLYCYLWPVVSDYNISGKKKSRENTFCLQRHRFFVSFNLISNSSYIQNSKNQALRSHKLLKLASHKGTLSLDFLSHWHLQHWIA